MPLPTSRVGSATDETRFIISWTPGRGPGGVGLDFI